VEQAAAGQILSLTGQPQQLRSAMRARRPLFAVALAAKNRSDDVKLSGALGKLIEEDPGLSITHDQESRQMLLAGQGEGHVRLAIERLKRRFGVEIDAMQPKTAYREAIQKGTTQRARHKKQSGGHGQFADVTIEVRPLPRGSGFRFESRIVGGVVPKQWVPAVEQGVRDGLEKGPHGFPVTDLEVTLIDGQTHSVDSSEMAFRIAGRLAIEEAMSATGTILLEPIEKLTVFSPSPAASNVTSALTARRGQILGLGPREDWRGWERIEAYLPQSERQQLIAELRGLTQGLGAFEADFDHMSELTGRLAEEAANAAKQPAGAH
jgi:elongation factor G